MKSIFGRYIPGNTFMYRIDPRIKVLLSILIIILIFIASSFIEIGLILLFVSFIYVLSTKKIRPVFKLLKLPLFISVILFFVNMYTVNSQTVFKNEYYVSYFWSFFTHSGKELEGISGQKVRWIDFYDPKIVGQDTINYYINTYGEYAKVQYGFSLNSLNRTLSLMSRIYIMVLTTSLLTNTTRPILLNKSIESLLWPLKFLLIPTHIVATIISIALRFIPTLVDEANRIIKAQSSRGVDFKHGNTKEKIVAFTTLIIPLFVSSFQKAEDLSNSMETRGYDPYEKRTKYRVFKLKWTDFLITFIFISILILFVLNHIIVQNSSFNPIEWSFNAYHIGHYTVPNIFIVTKIVA
ncbi:cobalt/nickel transport system permease protein [Mycoplasmopsis canis UF31]|uniref:energy-coupling factor transporter transmembrane component T family protein n=1 Tax=Mycoplasmopsis canis TaxID=29555 RepID=UPI00025AEA0A|nr:energy-coupling factor transporter transmembrane component T [Mycoplasmopsis canis]EIE39260.1 cobalt/nickel transport system permease protein [Mycoplasmopsis canis UF33]EIE39563.1 cobalt/nickel transport system permease protein [Mycoplasmopsis canis UF31]